MSGCGHDCGGNGCGGGCGSCCGSNGNALELTEAELTLLARFAQIPFLPVARRWDSETPVYLDPDFENAASYSDAILGLEQKRLIRLDYDLPLLQFDYQGYEGYPCRGSMALTARGQAAVDIMNIHGIEE